MYSNEYFNNTSNLDKDDDEIDNQTDILNNVREYIATSPKFKSLF